MPALQLSSLDEYLYNINFFDLVGVHDLSEVQKEELIFKMTRSALSTGIQKYITENDVLDETLVSIENKLNGQLTPLEAQEYLVDRFPGIINYIKFATVDLKKKALIKQIDDFKNQNLLDQNGTAICSSLIHSLSNDDLNEFSISFKGYQDIRKSL